MSDFRIQQQMNRAAKEITMVLERLYDEQREFYLSSLTMELLRSYALAPKAAERIIVLEAEKHFVRNILDGKVVYTPKPKSKPVPSFEVQREIDEVLGGVLNDDDESTE